MSDSNEAVCAAISRFAAAMRAAGYELQVERIDWGEPEDSSIIEVVDTFECTEILDV